MSVAQDNQVEFVVRVATRKQYYCERGFTTRVDNAERYPQQRDAEGICHALNALFPSHCWMVIRIEPNIVYVERPSVRQMTLQKM